MFFELAVLMRYEVLLDQSFYFDGINMTFSRGLNCADLAPLICELSNGYLRGLYRLLCRPSNHFIWLVKVYNLLWKLGFFVIVLP